MLQPIQLYEALSNARRSRKASFLPGNPQLHERRKPGGRSSKSEPNQMLEDVSSLNDTGGNKAKNSGGAKTRQFGTPYQEEENEVFSQNYSN